MDSSNRYTHGYTHGYIHRYTRGTTNIVTTSIVALLFSVTVVLSVGCSDHAVTAPGPPPPPPPPPGSIQLLDLTTYEGSGQAVHPDVVTTPASWGSTSQLVVTPYPEGNASYENPSVFIGHSVNDWTVPNGITNPIAHPASGGYLSDPDELYNPSTNELWLYYRQVTSTNQLLLIRSTDGVHWGAPVTLLTVPNHDAISPTVIRKSDTDWWLWSVNAGADGCTAASTTVELRHSTDGIHWSDPETTQLGGSNDFPWHVDVTWVPEHNQFWALYNAKSPGSCTTQVLRFATSTDGQHWTTAPSPVLTNGAIPAFADVVYRSSLQYDAATDMVTLWYSGARYAHSSYEWHVAVQQMSRAMLFNKVMTKASTAGISRNDHIPAGNTSPTSSNVLPPPLNDATAP